MTDTFTGHGSPECDHQQRVGDYIYCARCNDQCSHERGCARCRLYLAEKELVTLRVAARTRGDYDVRLPVWIGTQPRHVAAVEDMEPDRRTP